MKLHIVRYRDELLMPEMAIVLLWKSVALSWNFLQPSIIQNLIDRVWLYRGIVHRCGISLGITFVVKLHHAIQRSIL
jgi:hypothetical protein